MFQSCLHKLSVLRVLLLCAVVAITVESSAVSSRWYQADTDHMDSRKEELLGALRDLQQGRRSSDALDALAKAKFLYDTFAKKILRQTNDSPAPAGLSQTGSEDAALAEHELEDSLAKKSSALQDKPFVQHKGQNDFLVLKVGVNDPFVTVIPNDIYYNVEKKCVNWLDDCNHQGIRARLLQKVRSPFR